MKCPHCKKLIEDERIEKAHTNAENYGSNIFSLNCKKCGKYFNFYVERYTNLDADSVTKSDRKYSDF